MDTGVDSTRGWGVPSSRSQARKYQADQHALHIALARLNRRRLTPTTPEGDFADEYAASREMVFAEHRFVEEERRKVAARAAEAPREAEAFAGWFEELRNTGPGQYDSLFDYVADEATHEEIRWFMRQEVAGEAGFDDLVALVQIKMPEEAKLELARNYWDEMGRGKSNGMHGPMLTRLAQTLDVLDTPLEETVWESLALANLLVALAYNRRYAYHAIGALGSIELTSTTRAPRVVEALDRLGFSKRDSHYFRLHATVDIGHWRGWCDHVAKPIVRAHPEAAACIAEGALMRLTAGAKTFERYRAHFGLGLGGVQTS